MTYLTEAGPPSKKLTAVQMQDEAWAKLTTGGPEVARMWQEAQAEQDHEERGRASPIPVVFAVHD
jgi:hypothetical protein